MEEKANKKKFKLRNFVAGTWWVIRIYWRIYPVGLVLFIASAVFVEIEILISTYVRAWVIDQAVLLAGRDFDVSMLWPIGGVLLALGIAGNLIGNIRNYYRRQIRVVSDPKLRLMLYEKLKELGVQELESPELNNLVERAHSNIHHVRMQLENLTAIIGALFGLLSSVVIIYSFFPGYVFLVFLVSIPMIMVDQKFLAKFWDFDRKMTEPRRAAYQSMDYLWESKAMQELLITGGNRYLARKFENYINYWINWRTKVQKQWIVADNLVTFWREFVSVLGYLYAIWQFLIGKITIGMVTFYVGIMQKLGSSIFSLTITFNDMYEAGQRLDEFKSIFDLKPAFGDGHLKLPKMKLGPAIDLENVSFTYPGTKKRVINNLNLRIKAGEKVAIVGHNGAGKTTLVKLLCRFYQVSEGELLVDNVNINDLKIESWYKNVGVLFQDYNTYPHLTAMENIAIGKIRKKVRKSEVRKYAKRADAHSFISEFEKRYEQVLSEKYKGGVRPSTGQWQKIAIARFFYRDAPLVIFDEPTAAIDAVSEKKIFDKIYKFFEGKTVIIISHRFSTVRNADRIIVFEKGRIVEHGSHRELMEINGTYAKAFRIQAEGYN